ncbi:MAG: HAD-IA family hydrolase [Nanoarchaeota archaeon]|nr:HAD-IA family hydrolase [Nanoarchaeota archaeon]
MKAILFDLDNTLYDEKQFVDSGFKAVAEYISKEYHLKISEIYNILLKDFERGLRGKNFDVLLEKKGLYNKKLVFKLIKVYREHPPKLSPYKDIPEILENLKKYFKLGLVTDGFVKTQNNKISALGIRKFFDVVIITEDGKFWKPHQKPYELAIKKLKVPSEKVIFVGDALKDIQGANNLSMISIQIAHENQERIPISNHYVSNFKEILKIIGTGK